MTDEEKSEKAFSRMKKIAFYSVLGAVVAYTGSVLDLNGRINRTKDRIIDSITKTTEEVAQGSVEMIAESVDDKPALLNAVYTRMDDEQQYEAIVDGLTELTPEQRSSIYLSIAQAVTQPSETLFKNSVEFVRSYNDEQKRAIAAIGLIETIAEDKQPYVVSSMIVNSSQPIEAILLAMPEFESGQLEQIEDSAEKHIRRLRLEAVRDKGDTFLDDLKGLYNKGINGLQYNSR